MKQESLPIAEGLGRERQSLHLATYFSGQDKVLLIDGDPNRTAIAWSERGQLPFDVVDERKALTCSPR
ncbi:hypothetical protein [cf. Phormidesmis sp. LEGE 11477]|uniref:hypothetical protein n=1 Tax=cf. Phormidesmis sp. LEGE 11477 TaxID=1828680 RepID=UPI0018813A38|nr:hypothetical protein [cf. Phormidesmis sp. LEGE 11477]MBE9064734.1 hypothetical protein [cf. Phormidesmis sp. LEGE 11477]